MSSFPTPEVASAPPALGMEAPIAPEPTARALGPGLRSRTARGTMINGLFYVSLLLAGLDLWALVLGTLGGAWAAALVVALSSPYPLAFRYERGALREYASFSWPLFAGGASAVLVLQVPVMSPPGRSG